MKGYVIRKKYVEGPRKGESFIYVKGTAVVIDKPEYIAQIDENHIYKDTKNVRDAIKRLKKKSKNCKFEVVHLI